MTRNRLREQAQRTLDCLARQSRESGEQEDIHNTAYLGQCIVLFDMAAKSGDLSVKANNAFLRNALKKVEAAR